MTMQEFVDYLDKKIEQNENFIRITFYEIRVKYGLTESETNTLLELAKNKFENMGYSVYFTDAKYTYQNARMTVQPNELMIAVKEI
ncbi:MAG: hypothetical protein HFJ59_08085 [Clostridia bacterium]|nr:hypothetical protein [Clostridia bacterium]